MKVKRFCLICRKIFYVVPSRIKYGRGMTCSRKCQYILVGRKNSKEKTEVKCKVCGKDFFKLKSLMKNGKSKFCSKICAYRAMTLGITKHIITKPYNCKRKQSRRCLICNKEFIYRNKKQKYCSHGCFETAHKIVMMGKNNPSYIDGRSYNRRCFRGNEWSLLRKEIYERDKYICQDCRILCIGKRDADKNNSNRIIQCHHINGYKDSSDNKKEYLITLCLKCHTARHFGSLLKWGGGD